MSFKNLNRHFEVNLLMSSLIALFVFAIAFKAFANPAMIKADGSSTVFPITEAMAEEFQKETKGAVRVTVGISGTGGGFKKFCRGEIDVQNASRPIQTKEMEACKENNVKYFELPVGYDATVVVVNKANDFLTEVSVEDLKKMWEPEAQGKVMTWKQVNPAWPDRPLKLFGAGADSGTFDYFTEAIVGKAKSSRGDYTASEDDNTLVQGVSSDKNAIGYIPLSYYEENKAKLKALAVIGGEKAPTKKAVYPSEKTVLDGSYFPLSRPVFIYISEQSAKRKEVTDFTNFYLKNGTSLIPQVKVVPLPIKAYQLLQTNFAKGKMGTVFGGHSEVGLKIDDLIKREGKF